MMNFAATGYGRKLLESHIPRIVKALEKIAIELHRANELREAELEVTKEKEE